MLSNQRISSPKLARDLEQILDLQGERFLPIRSATRLEVREAILIRLLMRANQQLCKLAPGRTGLRQQFRNGPLQEILGEQDSRLEGKAADRRIRRCVERRLVQCFVEEPVRVLLKNLATTVINAAEGTRLPFSIIDRYDTDGAVSASICMQRTDRSSSVRLCRLRSALIFVPRKCARRFSPSLRLIADPICEINNVKFLLSNYISRPASMSATQTECLQEPGMTLDIELLDTLAPLRGASFRDVVGAGIDLPLRYSEFFVYLNDGTRRARGIRGNCSDTECARTTSISIFDPAPRSSASALSRSGNDRSSRSNTGGRSRHAAHRVTATRPSAGLGVASG